MEPSEVYRYLFPFEKIPSGSKIVIYGAGVLGQEYLRQLLITKYCQVVGFVDQNYEKYPSMVVPILSPETVRTLDFDYIVIALRDGFALSSILPVLEAQGIEKGRIVSVLERVNASVPIFKEGTTEGIEGCKFAYERAKHSMALYLAGGFGDMVCHKRFLMELVRCVPDAKMDIYAQQHEAYLRWLYDDFRWVQNIFLDAGFHYQERSKEYSLAMSIYGPKFLQVDIIRTEDFADGFDDFSGRILKLRHQCEEAHIGHATPSLVAFLRHIYMRETCYTWFNHGGIFSIYDYHVSIPFLRPYADQFAALGLRAYITVNVGNGTSKHSTGIAKAWPLVNFQQTVALFREQYPSIAVVQLGAVGEPLLDAADYRFMGEPFGFVAYILRDAIFHLDIEGGLVHLASQIGTKCIVLFGPTSAAYFGYDENINIRAGRCHDCAGLYPSVDVCARHLEKPECMYSITPDTVMESISEYMQSCGRQSKSVEGQGNDSFMCSARN